MRALRWSVVLMVGWLGCAAPDQGEMSEAEKTETLVSDARPVRSLAGEVLEPMELSAETRAELEANLEAARADFESDPANPQHIIWMGRRLAYLWRYWDAIDVYTRGIELHPDVHELYRHRGHRYITVRQFDEAIADLEKAVELIQGVPDEVEPDGAPNEAGIPRSTSHSNIWYHLGLAYYLKGDFEDARRAYEACLEFARVNDDMYVATADWLYMTYRRLGRDEEARELLETIREEMDILESFSYHKRLLMYKGLVSPAELLEPEAASELDLATQGYGVGNWYLYNGEAARAREIFDRVVSGEYWSAFGYIAAEAELHRMDAP